MPAGLLQSHGVAQSEPPAQRILAVRPDGILLENHHHFCQWQHVRRKADVTMGCRHHDAAHRNVQQQERKRPGHERLAAGRRAGVDVSRRLVHLGRDYPGDGYVGQGGDRQKIEFSPSSMLIFRGDVTRFVEGWGGSHEFAPGVFLAPRLRRNRATNFLNEGFIFVVTSFLTRSGRSWATYCVRNPPWEFPVRKTGPTSRASMKRMRKSP